MKSKKERKEINRKSNGKGKNKRKGRNQKKKGSRDTKAGEREERKEKEKRKEGMKEGEMEEWEAALTPMEEHSEDKSCDDSYAVQGIEKSSTLTK